MFISENILIYFRDNIPYILDVANKNEYQITDGELMQSLMSVARYSQSNSESEPLTLLCENNLVFAEREKALIKSVFNNSLTDLFHQGGKDTLKITAPLNKQQFAQEFLQLSQKCTIAPLPNIRSQQDYDTKNIYPLPTPCVAKLKNATLFDMLDRRQTIRQFYPYQVALDDLSMVLHTTFGHFHQGKEHNKDYEPFYRITSPSSGCLQAVQAYVIVYNVEHLEKGVYYYDAKHHSLCKESDELSYERLAQMLSGQFFAENCSFALFLTLDVQRFMWKYKTIRNYKVIFLETGHFSQTLQLVLTSVHLDCWITGAFMDSLIEDSLNISDKNIIPTFFLAAGKGYKKDMNDIMHDVLKTSDNSSSSL